MSTCTAPSLEPTRPRRRWSAAVALALCTFALLVTPACRRPQVVTIPPLPDLEVPLPPPRNVEPPETQTPQPVSLVDVPARTVERPRVAAPPPPRESRPEPRPEPPAADTKPPEEGKPVTTLQVTSTDRDAEVETRIRGILSAANTDLNQVDYRKLEPDAQMQYETVKSFMRQAEDALKSKNMVFAQTMAEKAATLASQLR